MFSSFSPKRRTFVFCSWCGVAKRSDKLKWHCQTVHNAPDRALGLHENPKRNAYVNQSDYMNKYPNVNPVPKIGYEPYKRAITCGSIFPIFAP